MLITAEQKNLRQTPRKARLVANTVRSLPLAKAVEQLTLIQRRAAESVLKVIQTAIANAINNHGLKLEDLTLKNIIVKDGPIFHRMQPGSRGRSKGLDKRTCHVEVILESKPEVKKVEEKKTSKTEIKKVSAEKKVVSKAIKVKKEIKNKNIEK
jgi:large subunit ribosomal protein L22